MRNMRCKPAKKLVVLTEILDDAQACNSLVEAVGQRLVHWRRGYVYPRRNREDGIGHRLQSGLAAKEGRHERLNRHRLGSVDLRQAIPFLPLITGRSGIAAKRRQEQKAERMN